MMADLYSWEKLNTGQINDFCRYCEEHRPKIGEEIQPLNIIASRAIIEGLQMYGWTVSELADGGSRLMDLVGKYVDLKSLTDQVVAPLEGHTSQKRPISSSKTLERGAQKKQRQGLNEVAYTIGLPRSLPSDNEGNQPNHIAQGNIDVHHDPPSPVSPYSTVREISHSEEDRIEPNEEIRISQRNELSEDHEQQLLYTTEDEPRQEGLTAHTLESYDSDRPSRYANDFEKDKGYEAIFNMFVEC